MTNDANPDPSFLVLKPFHLSNEKAKATVTDTLRRCEVECPEQGWGSLTLTWNNECPPVSSSFSEVVSEARRTGVVARLQDYLDRKDAIFGGTFADLCTPNMQLKCKVEYAGWSKEVQGPCRTACVERDLMDDILDYRRQACEHSNEYDFRLTARNFRGYLSACITLIDAFINRHILIAKHEGFSSAEFNQLRTETKLEEKVRLWWTVCSSDDPSYLFQSNEWCHFQELRAKRNEILHVVDPISVYSLKEIQRYLNKVRTGIGELLLRLRKAHQKSTLGFIERLRTAPLVDFMKIRFKGDGQHKIKPSEGR